MSPTQIRCRFLSLYSDKKIIATPAHPSPKEHSPGWGSSDLWRKGKITAPYFVRFISSVTLDHVPFLFFPLYCLPFTSCYLLRMLGRILTVRVHIIQGPPWKMDAALYTAQLEWSEQDKKTAPNKKAGLGQQLKLPPPPNLRSDRVTIQAS